MIYIHTDTEFELLKETNRINFNTLKLIARYIRPGVSTKQLDKVAEEYILSQGGTPAFKGYHGYPATLCTSIDEEIVHGIPSEHRILEEGQIIGIDVGTIFKGFYGDAAYTYKVGKVTKTKEKLLKVTREALYIGIEQAKPGNHLSDIGHAIQVHVENNGFSVVRALVGHGIGKTLHAEPEVPNYGPPGRGPILKPGMCLAIEPMVNAGNFDVYSLDDGWTVVTADGKPSAHFEHSIMITKEGPFIMADKENGSIEFYGQREIN